MRALVAVLLLAVWPLAQAEESASISPAELRELADFASWATGSPKLTALPVITRLADPTKFEGCRCKPMALFIAGTIYVEPSIDLASAWGKGHVVHELTHAVQAQKRGANFDCAEFSLREAEAIDVQNKWLTGKTARRAMFVSNCYRK